MEHIINKIIEIEKSAHQRIVDAKNEQSGLPLEIQKILHTMEEMYMSDAKKRLEDIIKKETADREEIIEQMEANHKKRIEKLNEITTEHINSWIGRIYQDIISLNLG